MTIPIQVLRGLESARSGETPAAGEPLWTTDDKLLYIGDGSTAGGILIGGSGAVANGHYTADTTVPGITPSATGTNSLAMGDNAVAPGAQSIAIGLDTDSGAGGGQDDTIAIGNGAQAVIIQGIAIGTSASAGGTANAIAIGQNASTTASSTIAISTSATSSAIYAISIGSSSDSTGTGSIAIGGAATGAQATAQGAIALGDTSDAAQVNSIAIGNSAVVSAPTAAENFSVALGGSSTVGADSDGGMALGPFTSVTDNYGVAIGQRATSTAANAVAVGGDGTAGQGADATAAQAIAIGFTSTGAQVSGIAIGNGATVTAPTTAEDESIAIGAAAVTGASADGAIAIGAAANVTANYGIAIGQNADATGLNSIAIGGDSVDGDSADAAGTESIAIGKNSSAATNNSIAIGEDASVATNGNSMAIGGFNTVTGSQAISISNAVSGFGKTVSGDSAVSIGTGDCTATGAISIGGGGVSNQFAISLGGGSVAGDYSHAYGSNATTDGANAVAIGGGNFVAGQTTYAVADRSLALGQAKTDIYGEFGYTSSDQLDNVLRSEFTVWGQTTNATPANINPDGGTTNLLVVPASTLWGFSIFLTAHEPATGDSKIIEFRGGIKRDGANNTALVGTVSEDLIAEDAGASAWSVAVTANDTNEALQIQVTGEASHTINWIAHLVTRRPG